MRLRQRCRDLERAVAHARFAAQCAHAEIAALRHALGYPPAPPPPFPVAVAPLPPLDVAASKSKDHPPPASLGSLDDDRDATEPAALERGETKRPSRSICRSTMNRDRYRFVRRTRSRAWSVVDGIGEGAGVVVVSRRRRRRAPNPNRRVVASVGFRSSPFVVARGEAARALSAAPRRATRAKECEPSSNDATIRIRRRGGLRRGERRGTREVVAAWRVTRVDGCRPTNPRSNPASARARVVFCFSLFSIARVCIREGNTSCRLAPPIIRAGRMHLVYVLLSKVSGLVVLYDVVLLSRDRRPSRPMHVALLLLSLRPEATSASARRERSLTPPSSPSPRRTDPLPDCSPRVLLTYASSPSRPCTTASRRPTRVPFPPFVPR